MEDIWCVVVYLYIRMYGLENFAWETNKPRFPGNGLGWKFEGKGKIPNENEAKRKLEKGIEPSFFPDVLKRTPNPPHPNGTK